MLYKMIEAQQLINKYKMLCMKLDLNNFNLYEIELLLKSKNIDFHFIKKDKSLLYFSGENINIIYNTLVQYQCYTVMLFNKDKKVSVALSSVTNTNLKQRKAIYKSIISEMFNKDLSFINKKNNENKKKFKDMSDTEISLYKQSLNEINKIKKEFVNIIEKLCV